MATNKSEQVVPVNRLNEEEAQPFYDLAWAHGASSRSNFAGDELEALVFSPSEFEAFCVALIATLPQIASVAQADWLQSDGLLYRLTDELHPENRDEINVTMADGSRSIESRARRASELLDKLSATPVVPASVAQDDWRELFWSVARALNCLPSTYVDGNAHVYKQAEKYAAIATAAPVAQLREPPEGWKQVPLAFVQGFHTLAHNYSLTAEAPCYYSGVESDAFSSAYRRCGQDLARLRAMLAAAPTTPKDAS